MAARSSATAAFLLVLLVSLLAAVAHCRTLEADPATDASAESTALVEAGAETVRAEAGATTEADPAEQDGFIRLPSHRIHRHPFRHGHLQRHFWWALRRGAYDDSFGGHRFHHHRPRGEARAHMAVDAAAVHGEWRRAEEVESVAEPDPDRSVADGHVEDVAAAVKPIRDGHDEEGAAAKPWRKEMVWSSFRDGHDAEDAAVKPWKKEMLWRMFRHGLRHHHHHHREEEHEQEEEATVGVKQFHHHLDAVEEEGEEKKMRKPFHFHHRHHDDNEEKTTKPLNHAENSDSDDEDDEVEEMIRRFRKTVMRQRFGHGRRFHHHRHHGRHHQAEEAEQANGESSQAEEGGVVTWIKGLMNRF